MNAPSYYYCQPAVCKLEKKKLWGCAQVGGDCPVGARDKDNFCLHPKYCSKKVRFGSK